MEEIQDCMDKLGLNIKDNTNDLETKIFKELEIDENMDGLLQQRIRSIIFQLQTQNGTQKQLKHKLPSLPSKLQFSDTVDKDLADKPIPDKTNSPLSLPAYYKDMKNMFLNEMGPLIKQYTEQRFEAECNNEQCDQVIAQNGDDIYQCQCIKRISVFLKVYKTYYKEINTEKLSPNVCFNIVYCDPI